MSVAKDIQHRLANNANLEFTRDGYRLSLNPIEDRHHEIGFILWRDADGDPLPIASGRTAGDDLVVDDASNYDGDIESLISTLLQGDPVSVNPPPDTDRAVPTGA